MRSCLAKAQRTAATAVDQDARLPVHPDQIARRCTLILEFGTTGTQHLQLHSMAGARSGSHMQRQRNACAPKRGEHSHGTDLVCTAVLYRKTAAPRRRRIDKG